jgi:hypothetical protein
LEAFFCWPDEWDCRWAGSLGILGEAFFVLCADCYLRPDFRFAFADHVADEPLPAIVKQLLAGSN